ncbi:class B acid phosphatase, partial [Escherichia coli]|nr:class B acid phosphatase [Escherichia coli]
MNRKMKSICIMIATGLLSVISAVNAASPDRGVEQQGATLAQLTYQYPVHWVSVEQIARSLENKKPISVGFDIDDTVLFSSPVFFRGKQKYSPDSDDYLNNQQFWDEASNGWDRFSIPKKSAKELIKLHLSRGDNIYFITGRTAPSNGKEDLTATIQDDFQIPANKLNKVIFAGGAHKDAKVEYIKKHNISIYYGDSDNDILDARKANAEGIRVLRALNSTYIPLPVNGKFGEKVVI